MGVIKLQARAGRTWKFGCVHVGLWRPRFWTLALRTGTATSWLVLALGPVSLRIAR